MCLLVLWTIITITYVCQNWVFKMDRDTSNLSLEELSFELWLWIELMFIFSFIIGGIVFAFFRKIKHPVLCFSGPLLVGENYGDCDFMESY